MIVSFEHIKDFMPEALTASNDFTISDVTFEHFYCLHYDEVLTK